MKDIPRVWVSYGGYTVEVAYYRESGWLTPKLFVSVHKNTGFLSLEREHLKTAQWEPPIELGVIRSWLEELLNWEQAGPLFEKLAKKLRRIDTSEVKKKRPALLFI